MRRIYIDQAPGSRVQQIKKQRQGSASVRIQAVWRGHSCYKHLSLQGLESRATKFHIDDVQPPSSTEEILSKQPKLSNKTKRNLQKKDNKKATSTTTNTDQGNMMRWSKQQISSAAVKVQATVRAYLVRSQQQQKRETAGLISNVQSKRQMNDQLAGPLRDQLFTHGDDDTEIQAHLQSRSLEAEALRRPFSSPVMSAPSSPIPSSFSVLHPINAENLATLDPLRQDEQTQSLANREKISDAVSNQFQWPIRTWKPEEVQLFLGKISVKIVRSELDIQSYYNLQLTN